MFRTKILSAAAACLLFCTGCAGQPASSVPPQAQAAAETLQKPFQAAADIRMGGIEASADLNKSEDGVFSFVFQKPATISGMTVTMDRETIGLSYLGLHVEADSEEVLNSAVTKAIVAAINRAAQPEGVSVSVEGTAITVSGETETGDFSLTLDQRNQSLLTLSIPSLDLECSFGGQQEPSA